MQTIFTYNGTDRKVQYEIEKRVGKSFSFFDKIKMGGNGSPQLFVSALSDEIKPYFKQSADRKFVNIELRQKGLLIYLKNESNDFIVAFPYVDLMYKISGSIVEICYSDFMLSLENKNTKNYSKFWNNFIQLYTSANA